MNFIWLLYGLKLFGEERFSIFFFSKQFRPDRFPRFSSRAFPFEYKNGSILYLRFTINNGTHPYASSTVWNLIEIDSNPQLSNFSPLLRLIEALLLRKFYWLYKFCQNICRWRSWQVSTPSFWVTRTTIRRSSTLSRSKRRIWTSGRRRPRWG